MNDTLSTDRDTLIDEVTRYLASVDEFRSMDCEPTWRSDRPPDALEPLQADASKTLPSDIRLH